MRIVIVSMDLQYIHGQVLELGYDIERRSDA
jgi:hypothetical protein